MITSDKFELLDNFARHWQKLSQSRLLCLSPQGEVVLGGNGRQTQPNWLELLNQTRLDKPTFLNFSQQAVLAASLKQNGQIFGYLLALNAQAEDVVLMTWGIEALTTNLANTQALDYMTDELIGAWNQLELIYRVTQNLALTSDLIAILTSILEETQRVVNTQNGFILFETGESFTQVTCQPGEDQSPYNKLLLNNLIEANQVVVCESRAACRAVWPMAPDYVKNLIATPLIIVEENASAAIGLINKSDHTFTAGDAKLLAALAQQVAAIIKNFLTHEKLIVEERLSRELEIAAEIQESLHPSKLPEVGGVSMAVSSIPASEVGGDFYDFITVDDRYLTVVIGDVSGKGIPAAMLTSVTKTMLRVEAMRGEPPHRIIQRANRILHQDLNSVDAFVTVFVATVDTLEGELTYSSAGHTPTLVYRAETQTVEQLKSTSLPVGVFGYQQSEPVTTSLNPGDTLVFYTDGIIEAQSPQNEFFGLDRLVKIVKTEAVESPELLRQSIQAQVAQFHKNAPNDDATLLIVKMLPYSDTVTSQTNSTLIKTVDFTYPADIDYLNEISRQISATCRELPLLPVGSHGDDFIYLVELAISEICTNVMKHAYRNKKGEISGQLTLLKTGIKLDFFDQGESFDLNSVPIPKSDPNDLTEGGYGLHIVRQIMDVVSYESHPTRGNHWHLEKYLPNAE